MWPFKDYDYYGDRFINIKTDLGYTMWYDREIDREKTPTECELCLEAENNSYTNYAHPKAHAEANEGAIEFALCNSNKNTTEDSLDFYIFYYAREYRRLYTELYKKYKEEYSKKLLEKSYDKVCQHHLESLQYHNELNLH